MTVTWMGKWKHVDYTCISLAHALPSHRCQWLKDVVCHCNGCTGNKTFVWLEDACDGWLFNDMGGQSLKLFLRDWEEKSLTLLPSDKDSFWWSNVLSLLFILIAGLFMEVVQNSRKWFLTHSKGHVLCKVLDFIPKAWTRHNDCCWWRLLLQRKALVLDLGSCYIKK